MVALEVTSSTWVVGILGVLLGAGLGSIITYLMISRHRRAHQLQMELNQANERFSDYRDQVTLHFMRTSELVQEMTQSYRSVYEHLAVGAQHLCGEHPDAGSLDHQETDKLSDASAANALDRDADADYDEMAELSSIRHDLDQLLGESPRISDLDVKLEDKEKKPMAH